MMNVLLVEPAYKNKYPPLGLMKLSTYHKSRGDSVKFVKGIISEASEMLWDRIYITTLFTFDFDVTVKTVRHYKNLVNNINNIYIGGIMASLMPQKLSEATGINIDNIIVGQLASSLSIGFKDAINIDLLIPDYEILNDISYKYPAGDNYITYTTRGCPNNCLFCAVPKLEPEFKTVNSIYDHINEIDKRYGRKRNLLLLDNNILNSPHLKEIIDDIHRAGFIKSPNYIDPLPYEIIMPYIKDGTYNQKHIGKLKEFLINFKKRIPNEKVLSKYEELIGSINSSENFAKALMENSNALNEIFNKYRNKVKKQRYVDFNQGIDGRLLNEEKMSILSTIPIRPLRIAFDSMEWKDTYIDAVRLAHKYGIKEISNYMLYNYNDNPDELWHRLRINIDLHNELGVHIFSFPMKFMPINKTDRLYIGKHWNKKYLQSIPAILLVTKGIVADGESFFEKAFGKDINEYHQILAMPKDFITYRFYFEENGLTFEWQDCYSRLSEAEKEKLIYILSNGLRDTVTIKHYSKELVKIMDYYSIRYDNLVGKKKSNKGVNPEQPVMNV